MLYLRHYTFNDHTISDTVDTLLLAWRLYRDSRYLEAVRKAGAFILAAQQRRYGRRIASSDARHLRDERH